MTVKLNRIKLLLCGLLVGIAPSDSYAVKDGFETLSPGKITEGWAESGHDAAQKNLWQVGSINGRNGSKGISLSSAAHNSYSLISSNSCNDTEFELRVDFKLGISADKTHIMNDPIFGIALADSTDNSAANKQLMLFVRRDGGTKYGFALNGSVPIGWSPNNDLGLPNVLPADGSNSTSEWFTMVLGLSDNGDDTWTISGSILNEMDSEVLFGSQAVNMASGVRTFYPCVTVDWTANALKDGCIKELIVDNVILNEEDY